MRAFAILTQTNLDITYARSLLRSRSRFSRYYCRYPSVFSMHYAYIFSLDFKQSSLGNDKKARMNLHRSANYKGLFNLCNFYASHCHAIADLISSAIDRILRFSSGHNCFAERASRSAILDSTDIRKLHTDK